MVACGKDAYPINQLKYVSRQLYKETAGTEIQHNLVKFHGEVHTHAGSISGFLNFIRDCTPRHLSWLTRVFLQEHVDWSVQVFEFHSANGWLQHHMKSIVKALRVCAANPHM
jgi:hypothetical protein